MKANRTLPRIAPEGAIPPRPARVVAFPSPWEPARKTAGIAVTLTCGAVAMWYLPLFAGVLRLRFAHHDWPLGTALAVARSWAMAAVVTGLLSASALTLAARATNVDRAVARRSRIQELIAPAWPASLVSSAGLSVASIFFHYRTCTALAAAGLDLRSGPAGSVLFGFIMLDLAAMGVGAAALLVMTIRLLLGRWHPARPLPSSLWSVYLRCATSLAALGFLFSFIGT